MMTRPRVFLSASVPLPSRNPLYFDTADVLAIRDATRALVIVAQDLDAEIVFGGHPAITPMIRLQVASSGRAVGDRVTLFQSAFYRRDFPLDNRSFERVVITEVVDGDRDSSLALMRSRMLEGSFACGIFIGGMEGVEEEFFLFRKLQPDAPAHPIASTGAAARRIYLSDAEMPSRRPELETEISYVHLMRHLLAGAGAGA